MQKRVVAVHDISCVGKCSLTVALPILSAAGIETSIIPTAILSTHTGGFTGYTFRDLTADIDPIVAHWESLNLKVDSIYTGYLGSFEQLNIVSSLIDRLGKDALILIDPVMGDSGRLYSGFSAEFAKGMAQLCGKADIIIPNLTEAAFMLGEEYVGSGYDREYIEGLLKRLAALGCKKVVLSGISFEEKLLGAAAYDAETDTYEYYFREEIPGYYHGTGDVFGSALLSALLNGKSLLETIKIAVDYTVECIRLTHKAGTDVRYGVNFENAIPQLIKAIKE
ncbi:MAG: pyridoxamine kinase [Ruminococcaceae bacterium]|nr:pyridoxamine kinase [Oscillospiraceae bacterium]